MIQIDLRGAPSKDQECREIEQHLRVWQASNPAVSVDLVT
jgi:hypothetical protein